MIAVTLGFALTALNLDQQTAQASTYFVSNNIPVTWSGLQSVRCLSPSTFPPGSVAETMILEAMALWNIVPAADFEFMFTTLEQDFPIDHFDGFNDTVAVLPEQLDPGVIGVTFLVNDGEFWFDADVLFSNNPANVGYSFDGNPSCEVITEPTPVNGFSFLLMAVHEMGHALGLGHDPVGNEPPGTPFNVATMNPRYPSGGPVGQFNIVETHTDDRNGIRFLYPHSGPSGVPLVDLANSGYMPGAASGQAVPIAIRPTTAFPGETVTLQNFIENFGTTSEFFVPQGFYLSDDPLMDAGDRFLGELRWDIAFGDAFLFGVQIDLPQDMAPGTYYLGSVLDDLNVVAEEFEDNNAAVACDPLLVRQFVPVIDAIAQQVIPCSDRYTGSLPAVSHPINMSPIVWSLDNPPNQMTIDSASGEILWVRPVPSQFLYAITLRATNGAGSSTQTFFLGVELSAPRMVQLPEQVVSCRPEFESMTPMLTFPRCMEPILFWSIDQAPDGVTVDGETGVLTWLNPMASDVAHQVTLRVTNIAGSSTMVVPLTVLAGDMDGDARLSQSDLFHLWSCMSGPARIAASGCSCGDGDADGDLDLRDIGRFLNAYTD